MWWNPPHETHHMSLRPYTTVVEESFSFPYFSSVFWEMLKPSSNWLF